MQASYEVTPQIERRWPRDGWGRRLISKTTAISAERPTTTLRGLPSLPFLLKPRARRVERGRDSSTFFCLRFPPGVDCIFCGDCHWAISERKPSIVQRASEQRQCHAVSPFTPLLPIRTGVEKNNAVWSLDGVSKMDGAEFCSKVTATSIKGGNGDIAWD